MVHYASTLNIQSHLQLIFLVQSLEGFIKTRDVWVTVVNINKTNEMFIYKNMPLKDILMINFSANFIIIN